MESNKRKETNSLNSSQTGGETGEDFVKTEQFPVNKDKISFAELQELFDK